MTYAEKVAELERLKAEIRGKAPILSGLDFSTARTEREDEEGIEIAAAAAPVEQPLTIAEEEAQRLFPKRDLVAIVPKGSITGRGGLPDDFVQLMYRCYLRGKSIEQVGAIYGRSRQAVHEIFKRRGLKLRPDSKALARVEFTYKGVCYAPGKSGYLRATSGDRIHLHHVIWEEFHGPIPEGNQICFKDRDKRNFDLNNLECLPAIEVLARVRTGENQYTRRAA